MRWRQKEVGKDGDDGEDDEDYDEDEVEGDNEDPCEGEKRKRFGVSSKYRTTSAWASGVSAFSSFSRSVACGIGFLPCNKL